MKNEKEKKEKSPEAQSKVELIVKGQFRDYKKGDRVTEIKEIDKILSSHESNMVIKVVKK